MGYGIMARVEAAPLVLKLLMAILCLVFIDWVATRAQRKGKSYRVVAFACAASTAVVIWAPALVLALVELSASSPPGEGDNVETLRKTELDDGRMIPRKYRARVLAAKVIDQTQVVQIAGPERSVWVARDGVCKR